MVEETMAKNSSIFVCQNCAASYPKWQGQCESCGEWGTIVEEAAPVVVGKKSAGQVIKLTDDTLVPLTAVRISDAATKRISTGIFEFDRVLGGGMVPGAVMLIGGEPGIGKSTLLTQMMLRVLSNNLPTTNNLSRTEENPSRGKAKAKSTKKTTKPQDKFSSIDLSNNDDTSTILYVSGEESPSQIALRINRFLENEHKNELGDSGNNWAQQVGQRVLFETSTMVESICQRVAEQRPKLLIVDSIQTVTTPELTGAAGSVGQLREVADQLTATAKKYHIPTFLVGHVTKEGTIAGPKVLEHIVDSVLELSGERTGQLRILRAIKNRFGATDEVGVFQHTEFGLDEVTNPSDLFLEQAQQSVPGSVVVCILEGTRPLLVEVQSLVVSSQLAMPRRVGRGIELSRIQVLSAVLQKHAKLPLGTADIFLSAAGGLTIKEPAVDLGLAVAMASSLKNKALPPKTVFIGEVGLLGEIRAVSYLDRRIKEAKRLGFTTIISRQTHQRVADVLKQFGL
jgi:DNA repair protein RadA/Sms